MNNSDITNKLKTNLLGFHTWYSVWCFWCTWRTRNQNAPYEL